MEIGFSLGSNLGDRLALLRAARDRVLAVRGTAFAAQSPVYETLPVGVLPDYEEMMYYNAVVLVNSAAPASEWLASLSAIERDLGRVRTADRNAPRTIDVDVIYAGEKMVDGDGLIVPHPRWADRRFVLEPLCDVRPDLVLPGATGPVKTLLKELVSEEQVTVVHKEW